MNFNYNNKNKKKNVAAWIILMLLILLDVNGLFSSDLWSFRWISYLFSLVVFICLVIKLAIRSFKSNDKE